MDVFAIMFQVDNYVFIAGGIVYFIAIAAWGQTYRLRILRYMKDLTQSHLEHQKWHEDQSEKNKLPYKKLSEIYDLQVHNYISSKKDENLIEFINQKFTIIHNTTKYLYDLDYLNFDNSIVSSNINKARDEIYNSAKRNLNKEFATKNKEYNNNIFHRFRTDIQSILADKTKNDKQNRIVSKAVIMLRDSIYETSEAYKACFYSKKDSHSDESRREELHYKAKPDAVIVMYSLIADSNISKLIEVMHDIQMTERQYVELVKLQTKYNSYIDSKIKEDGNSSERQLNNIKFNEIKLSFVKFIGEISDR